MGEAPRDRRPLPPAPDGPSEAAPVLPALACSLPTYRAAVLLATGGHLTESYAVLRSCLEDTLYAAFIGIDEERFKRWAARHDDAESLKAMKGEFRIGGVMAALREKTPRIADLAEALYDRTIDLGGHPNPMALFSRLHPDGAKEEGTLRADYLTEKDSVQLQLAIKTICQSGICWTSHHSSFQNAAKSPASPMG